MPYGVVLSSLGVVLSFAIAFTVFAEGDRSAIEEAIDSYEAVVNEAEALAEMHLVDPSDFSDIDAKAEEAGEKIAEIESVKDWLIEDAKRSAELNVRFNEAISTIVHKLLNY